MDSKKTGDLGEEYATQFLMGAGFEILDRNWRYSRFGELDIIAKEGDTLVFIEVKTDKTGKFGNPEFWVTQNKQSQIRKIAEAYIFEKEICDTDIRFDVVGVIISNDKPWFRHIKNAF